MIRVKISLSIYGTYSLSDGESSGVVGPCLHMGQERYQQTGCVYYWLDCILFCCKYAIIRQLLSNTRDLLFSQLRCPTDCKVIQAGDILTLRCHCMSQSQGIPMISALAQIVFHFLEMPHSVFTALKIDWTPCEDCGSSTNSLVVCMLAVM